MTFKDVKLFLHKTLWGGIVVKKIIVGFMVVILIFLGVGCANSCSEESREEEPPIQRTFEKRRLNIVDIDEDQFETIIQLGIMGNKYYYVISEMMQENDEFIDAGVWSFYEYNLDTDENIFIGKIEYVHANSAVNAFLNDGKIVMTISIVDEEFGRVNNHYLIDVNERKIEIIHTDTEPGTHVIMNFAVNDSQFITRLLWPIGEATDEWIFRYEILLGNSDGDIQTIIEMAQEPYTGMGSQILAASTYRGQIHTLETRETGNDDDIIIYFVIYDLDGVELSRQVVPGAAYDFVTSGFPIWEYYVFGDYIYLSNGNNRSGLLLKRTSSGYEKIEQLSGQQMLFLAPSTYIREGKNEFIFYQWGFENQKFYRLFADSGRIERINFDSEGARGAVYNDNRLVIYRELDYQFAGIYYVKFN